MRATILWDRWFVDDRTSTLPLQPASTDRYVSWRQRFAREILFQGLRPAAVTVTGKHGTSVAQTRTSTCQSYVVGSVLMAYLTWLCCHIPLQRYSMLRPGSDVAEYGMVVLRVRLCVTCARARLVVARLHREKRKQDKHAKSSRPRLTARAH